MAHHKMEFPGRRQKQKFVVKKKKKTKTQKNQNHKTTNAHTPPSQKQTNKPKLKKNS